MSQGEEPTKKTTEHVTVVEKTETTVILSDGRVLPRVKDKVPPGMSKREFKRLKKRKQWDEHQEERLEFRRKKRHQAKEIRKRKIHELEEKGQDVTEVFPSTKRKIRVEEQIETGSRVIVDCAFDDLMLDKEIVSLANQIARSYADNRNSPYRVDLEVTSFNKRLKKRFEDTITDHFHWNRQQIKFTEEDLEEVLKGQDLSKVVYLSADTDEKIDELKPGETYIVGGIVDKNRHKNLCQDKAEKLGIQTKRLPIDEYIKISGRRVLATSHVVQLLIKWFEHRDWKIAFEEVIPMRKQKEEASQRSKSPTETTTEHANDNDDDNETNDAGNDNNKATETNNGKRTLANTN